MKPYQYLNKVNYLFYRLKTDAWYRFFLKRCGSNCVIYQPIFIDLHHLSLGDRVSIRNNGRIECVELGQSASVVLNDNVNIEQNVHLTCGNEISIGKNTAIAANVSITDIKHAYEDTNVSPKAQPLQFSKVIIGEECTIYNNAVILPGTLLGKHSVVAANSVVLGKKYPDYSVLAGNPAIIVKRYSVTDNKWLKTTPAGDFIYQ